MELVNSKAEEYAVKYSSTDAALLQEIIIYTNTNHAEKHMISGTVQGQLLQVLSKISKPKFILEIGTFTGYSALCLAEGLQEFGELHTIELREKDAAIAQLFFDKSIYKRLKLVIFHIFKSKLIYISLLMTF